MIDWVEVKEQFEQVIKHSQRITEVNIDELFEKYKIAKHIFISMFGDNLIYEYPDKISFSLDADTKRRELNDFIDDVADLAPYNDDFISFIGQLQTDEFYNNILEKDYVYKDKKIPKGSKIIKSFKHFITEENLLSAIQNKASMLIQENKIEGYLCFSVHPLDYLSSSENNHNWRSCHSLDGEYRAGNLSYMCDSSTMIVYLRSEDKEQLQNFPDGLKWNSKKWRCLLNFDDTYSAIFAGRQYPFSSEESLDVVREILYENILPNEQTWYGDRVKWSHWHNDQIKDYAYENDYDNEYTSMSDFHNYVVIRHAIYDLPKIVKDYHSEHLPPLHFNDLLRSSTYTKPMYMFKNGGRFPINSLEFNIGGDVKCVHCGKEFISSFDTMMCPDCEVEYGNSEDFDQYPVCDCCGRRFVASTGYYIDSADILICSECADTETFVCKSCGNRFFNDEMKYDAETDTFICKFCDEEE